MKRGLASAELDNAGLGVANAKFSSRSTVSPAQVLNLSSFMTGLAFGGMQVRGKSLCMALL